MGHYASEMTSDSEHESRAEAEERHLQTRAAKIKAAIEEKGIERVLAEIIDNPTMASIRYSGF